MIKKTAGLLLFGVVSFGATIAFAAATDNDDAFGVLLTPPGITLQVLGKGQGYDLGKQSAAALPRDEIAFADPRGLTLYTYKNDPPGKSVCAEACARTWQPVHAPANAEGGGRWSVVVRGDGERQWAYRGKPLYTYIKDVDPGSVAGNSPARAGARRKNGAGAVVGGGVRGGGTHGETDFAMPAEWHVALAYPASDIRLPTGITVKEVADAASLALVDNRGRTLYTFNGDPTQDTQACPNPCAWQPVPAAQLAEPTGGFAPVVRADGINQWSYKGKGLYTYAQDLQPGDANGDGLDRHWSVAAVYSYFLPPSVSLHRTPGQGVVLATKDGMTLYRRDGYIFQSGGGHSLRRGQPPRPAVGRDIGTDAHCDADCRKLWHPFKAPDNAEPQGFWSIDKRDDGTKQWAYQGYALWTYDGDKKPGDMNGNDSFTYSFDGLATLASDTKKTVDFGTPMDGAPALYWAIAVP